MSRNPGKNIGGREETDSLLFHDVEIRSEEIPSRARSIAVWIALFVCAILVSQFGRPSRAREAEFLHSAAKVEALGRSRPGSAPATLVHDNNAAHSMEAREATPAVYVSKKYGVAWQYPRTYVLRKGANANLNLAGQPAAASAFTGGGGVALATVNIPALLYPGTDFKSGSLTVRVNSQISEGACGQFGISDADGGQGESFPGTEVTVGTIDFAETGVNVDDASNAPGVATQERFYHAYDNDACYEFAMSVSTAAGQAPGAQVAVERDEIFERLTEILTSVTIVPRNGQAVTASGANHLPR